MTNFLILIAVIIFTCVFLNNATFRISLPVLLAFVLLGMVFCGHGFFRIGADDLDDVKEICSIALIFVLFYGGFGTNWKTARPVAIEASLLSTVGVIITAALVSVFCHYVLCWNWTESMLLGAILSSTDASSVFSILRSRKLGLKSGTAPLLEIESGSNDAISNILTLVMLAVVSGKTTAGGITLMVLAQLGFGVMFGLAISTLAVFILRRITFATSGFDSLLLIGIAIFAYAIPALAGGNGYLSVYIVGLVLGNCDFKNKKEMVHFFDGFTGFMQVLIFFMLGLLANPSSLQSCILPSLAIFAVLTLAARPLSVALILSPFRKYGIRAQTLVSFCGIRGTASIVFAIMAIAGGFAFENDIFNIVFCIILLSTAFQTPLMPVMAKVLKMTDKRAEVMKTFNDFADEIDLVFSEIRINKANSWCDKKIKDCFIPEDLLFCQVIHADKSAEIPDGDTVLKDGDKVIVCSKMFPGFDKLRTTRRTLSSYWSGKTVADFGKYKRGQLMILVRDGETIIPHGNTALHEGDVVFINKSV